MTVITEVFRRLDNVAPSPEDLGFVYFTVNERRFVSSGNYVLVKVKVKCRLVNGVLTSPDLVPGPAIAHVGTETYNIEIPDSSTPVRLWPLIDAGMPPPTNVPGFVRNAGGIARIQRTTIAEYAAMPSKDPETLYITFES
ncbi:hypothetical protein [Rhodococcus sp. IEGM 1379]|uniref:hypothetical protein n=1 Tax=Rhodococcus sp. IEGM 1379 TaxID=3047086 RepID=UPI0024B7F5C7|nr:hypothetical protein [Rhodococcus sp. IEGM 1379]MDI9914360.1 hypothetical protein [Rhodococcus sp. IEGM 1379]